MKYFGSMQNYLKNLMWTESQWNATKAQLYGIGVADDGLQADSVLAGNEAMVHSNISRFVNTAMRIVQTCQGIPMFFYEEYSAVITSSHGTDGPSTQGLRPDGLGVRSDDPLVFLFTGEFKHIHGYNKTTNLSDLYNSKDCSEGLKSPVWQVYSYMCVLGLKYGFLSIYNVFWFLVRMTDEKGVETLYISEPVAIDQKKPTAALAFCLFVLKVLSDKDSLKMQIPKSVVQQITKNYPSFPNNAKFVEKMNILNSNVKNAMERSGSNDGTSARKQNGGALQEFLRMFVTVMHELPFETLTQEPKYDDCKPLGSGRSGVTLKAHIEGFLLAVAVKIADIGKMQHALIEFRNERDVYMKLHSLWGTRIPALVWAGEMPYWRAGVITTVCGDRTLESRLSDDMKVGDVNSTAKVILTGLLSIHACGVAHGDVSLRNIVLFDEDDSHAMFIDFGFGVFVGDSNDTSSEELEKAQRRDFEQLENIFDSIMQKWGGDCGSVDRMLKDVKTLLALEKNLRKRPNEDQIYGFQQQNPDLEGEMTATISTTTTSESNKPHIILTKNQLAEKEATAKRAALEHFI